jgi:hypothetical protein
VWRLNCPEEVKNMRAFPRGTPLTAVYDDLSKVDFDHRSAQINDSGRLQWAKLGFEPRQPDMSQLTLFTCTSGSVTVARAGKKNRAVEALSQGVCD